MLFAKWQDPMFSRSTSGLSIHDYTYHPQQQPPQKVQQNIQIPWLHMHEIRQQHGDGAHTTGVHQEDNSCGSRHRVTCTYVIAEIYTEQKKKEKKKKLTFCITQQWDAGKLPPSHEAMFIASSVIVYAFDNIGIARHGVCHDIDSDGAIFTWEFI